MLKRLVPGDVAWAPDLFHDDDPMLAAGGSRPWVVVSNDSYPGQREGIQYLCCALTSNTASHPSMIPLDVGDWDAGKPRKPGQIDAETVQLVKHHWMTNYVGRISHAKLRVARKFVGGWLS